MDELLEALASLPILAMNDSQKISCLNFLSTLETKTPEAMADALAQEKDEEIKKTLVHCESLLITYLTAWQRMQTVLLQWYEHVELTWFQLTRKPIEADDLMSLLLILMPNDIPLLQKLKEQIDVASLVDNIHESGFILTNLLIAINAKLKPSPEDDHPQREVILVAGELNRHQKVKTLSAICDNYIAELHPKITHLFNQLVHFKDNVIKEYSEKNFSYFMQSIENEECLVLLNSETTALLLEKYLALKNMQQLLKSPHSTNEEKLKAYANKFTLYHSLSTKTLVSPSGSLPSEGRMYYFFPATTAEQSFLNLADTLTSDVEESQHAFDKMQLEHLQKECQAYITYLRDSIHSFLASQYFFKKGCNITNNEKKYPPLLQAMQCGKMALLTSHKSILTLLEKYFLMLDIKETLDKEIALSEKLHLFTVKYSHQQSLLRAPATFVEDNSQLMTIFNFNRLYSFFSYQTEEQTFLEVSQTVCGKYS